MKKCYFLREAVSGMQYSAEVIGKRIRFEREKRGWTQEKVGKEIGVVAKQISKYEKGDPCPPINMLLELCKLFDCELGYLLGEEGYSEGTRLQTNIRKELGLTIESTNSIKKVIASERRKILCGSESEHYTGALNKFLSSSFFPALIATMSDLDAQIKEKNQIYTSIKEKYGEKLFNEALEIYYGPTDYEHDSNLIISSEVVEVIKDLRDADDNAYNKSFAIKVARYELNVAFEELISDIYPR